MKHIGNEIKRLIEQKHLVKKEIADALGYTPTALSGIMRKESIDCALLVKICDVIGVSPTSFFDDEKPVAKPLSATEAQALFDLLNENERTIKILLGKIGTKSGQDG